MGLVTTSAPAVEPVGLEEVKEHLRIDDTADDILLAGLVRSARETVEQATGQALVTQGWSLFLDAWPTGGTVELPLWPVQAIGDVTVYDADDVGIILDPALYAIDLASRPARVALNVASPWPQPGRRLNGIETAFTAGYGASGADVPESLRLAVTMLVAHRYDRRGCNGAAKLPPTIAATLAHYREVRL